MRSNDHNDADQGPPARQLARERASLQAVFDIVNVGMMVIDEAGIVRRINNTIARWLGEPSQVDDQPGNILHCVNALSCPGGCGRSVQCAACPIRNAFESVLMTGEPVHDVETMSTLLHNGREVRLWLEVSADPLVLDGRRNVILAMSNVTARMEAEDALQRAAEELARSNYDLQQFAAFASHDLQEPLRTVLGFVELLRKKYAGQLDAEADTFIKYATDGIERMETLIRDLLAYARVGSRGKDPVPTDSGAALRQAMANLGKSVKDADAEIAFGELPTVWADSSQLTQLFQNLLSNALKYRSDAPPRINADVCRENDCWRFSVGDNGIGIEPKYQRQIFDAFRRLNDKRPGTGIGLAICQRIVERHGGRIWVESEVGHGAMFCFTIPG